MNTKQCIFCRKSPVTTEDIWGTWIGDYLGRRDGFTTTWSRGTDAVEHKVFRHRSYTG